MEQIFKVVVDYSLSLHDMIRNGKYVYDIINEFCDRRFPLKGKGLHKVELVLVDLNRKASTQEIQDFLEEHGLALAKVEHLLALGSQYPELQRQFPIVALGSSFVHGRGSCYYPYLYDDEGDRSLNFTNYPVGFCWDASWWRFLAIRKDKKIKAA